MEEAIVYVIEKALCEEIRSSNHWSIMIDETNSITDEKHLAVVSRHISHNVPVTRYLGMINLDELTAEAIAFDLKSFIIAKGLKVENLLHFGSDGAATLIGMKTDSVIDALRYDAEFDKKNHLASNLLDELNCDFIISTKYLADLMFILTKLINVFQREYVSFADIKIHLDMVYDAITAQFIGFDGSTPSYGTHLRKYMQDFNISPEKLPPFIKKQLLIA
ncbi:unnamed protein product [Rhizophagus irregularis]|nr:unnamed protein product [Rhizophagus irregularis]